MCKKEREEDKASQGNLSKQYSDREIWERWEKTPPHKKLQVKTPGYMYCMYVKVSVHWLISSRAANELQKVQMWVDPHKNLTP